MNPDTQSNNELALISSRILVVDDQPDNLLILEDQLSDLYKVDAVSSGEEALDYLYNGEYRPDMVLLDVVMPGVNGFDVCKQMQESEALKDLPVLFITSITSEDEEAYAMSIGAKDFIHKPFAEPVVKARIHTHLQLAQAKKELEVRNSNLSLVVNRQSEELTRRHQQLIASQSATITALCSLAEVRDSDTGNHILRTQNYVRVLAETLKDHPRFSHELTTENIYLIIKSAPLHDIGKVAIPDNILLKPGKLTSEEWEIMKSHTQLGFDAILQAEKELPDDHDSFLRYAREIVYSHHEKWDGSGYPQGLKADDIPVSARLMAAADVYDALISKRVYKNAFTYETAIELIKDCRGTHFDPDVADAVVRLQDDFLAIAKQYQDD